MHLFKPKDMSQDKFVVEVFVKEKIELRIKEIQDEIKRREEKLTDTIMDAINKKITYDTKRKSKRISK